MKLNRNSWHYWLATKYSNEIKWKLEDFPTDICTYSKMVLKGLLFAIFMAVTISFLTLPLIYCGFWLIMASITGDFSFPKIIILDLLFRFGIAEYLMIAFLGIIGLYFSYMDKKKFNKSEPGFIKQSYLSWKNKYCVKVEFRDGE